MDTRNLPAGWRALFSGANAARSLALACGVALHAVNVYIATTILPSVVDDIGGLDLYAWSTTIFVIASLLGSALSANLFRRAGPKGAYTIAAAIFALGSVCCAMAPSMPVLLAGRLIQGFGGGFLFALAYAMIRLMFAEALWPRAMALVSGMWGIATLIGPAIGGVFTDLGFWRAAFCLLVPAAALFVVLARAVLPGRADGPVLCLPVPVTQLSLLVAAVLAVAVGSTSADLLRKIIGIAIGIVLAAVLVRVETRSRQRLLPADAFRPASILAAIYATMFLLTITVTSGEIFMPLFMQVLHGQSTLVAGYLAVLMAAAWTTGSIVSSGARGRAIQRMIIAGPLFALAGVAALYVLMPRSTAGTWQTLVPICVVLAAIGFGVGLTWPHLLTSALKVVPPDEQEIAGMSITTVQLFATAVGAALAGMVVNAGGLIDPGGVEGTAQAARWLFGSTIFVPLVAIVSARRASIGGT